MRGRATIVALYVGVALCGVSSVVGGDEGGDRPRPFEVAIGDSVDWFNDGRDVWHEARGSFRYRTGRGPVIGRFSHADRFSLSDNQLELEWYPSIRPGTYGYLEIGASPEHSLYPQLRYAADLYQNLPRAFDVSLGFRQLWFSSRVDILTAMVGKYLGNWYLFTRLYVVPGWPDLSGSLHFTARWYFLDGKGWLGARYAHGLSSEALRDSLRGQYDVSLLSSDTVALDCEALIHGWRLGALASFAREARTNRDDLLQLSATATLGYQF